MSCQSSVSVPKEPIEPFPSPFDENGEAVYYLAEREGYIEMPLWYWESVLRWATDVVIR